MSRLRDQAHRFKEQYAQEKDRSLSLSYILFSVFVKYIAPSMMLIIVAYFAVFSFNAYAVPQGFSKNIERAAPQGFGFEATSQTNTVKGVAKNALNDDYVLLEGKFVTENESTSDKSPIAYWFMDKAGDKIEVDLSLANNTTLPNLNNKYYIWGQVKKSFFSTSISIIEFAPTR